MECLIYCVLYLFCFVFLVWFYLFVSPFSPECDMRLKSGLEMECLICICLFVCIWLEKVLDLYLFVASFVPQLQFGVCCAAFWNKKNIFLLLQTVLSLCLELQSWCSHRMWSGPTAIAVIGEPMSSTNWGLEHLWEEDDCADCGILIAMLMAPPLSQGPSQYWLLPSSWRLLELFSEPIDCIQYRIKYRESNLAIPASCEEMLPY